MEKRNDKLTGKKVSLLGYGCMRLPRLYEDEQDIDYDQAQEMIDYAYENGVNYFDTAYPYHEGMSETFIGQALQKYPRASFFLADKMPSWLLYDLSDGERIFEEQLEKCQVEYFDYYLCHALEKCDSFIKKYEDTHVYDYLLEQKRNGRIRHLGFSFHGLPDQLELLVDRHEWDFVQLQLNYYDWDVQNAKRQYRILEERGIPCIVMEPVRGGSLNSLCGESIRILKGAEPDRSVASWAIRFAATLPGVLTVLSGMSTMEQVQDNVKTMTDFRPLQKKDLDTLKTAVEAYLRTGTIPCTGCRYCMDCPMGVDIPKVFSTYNKCASQGHLPVSFGDQTARDKNAELFLEAYNQLPQENQAHHCVSCGKCMQHCPQKIKIPERMGEIARMVAGLRN
jgi:predicted aldo/keto reductase-like oxidoreductase